MTRLGRALWMSMLIGGVAWLWVPSVAHSQPEGLALIETRVPLEDTSDAGIKTAVDRAVDSAVRGAAAMGLSWVQLQRAYIVGGYVAVQVVAATEALAIPTDDEPASGPEPDRQDSGTLTRL